MGEGIAIEDGQIGKCLVAKCDFVIALSIASGFKQLIFQISSGIEKFCFVFHLFHFFKFLIPVVSWFFRSIYFKFWLEIKSHAKFN